MNDLHPLALAHVTHPGAPESPGTLRLVADADPALPVVPGQEITLSLTLDPAGGGYRTYGYLIDDSLAPAAAMLRHPGLSLLANGRYATYVGAGDEPRTVSCVIRVDPEAPDGATVLPRIVVGVMAVEGDRLVPSAAISDTGFRVRRHWLPGQCVTLRPGGRALLPAGHTPVPGLRLVAVGRARHGLLTYAPDGGVSYQAHPEHLGYDRFELAFEGEDGHRVWSEVTVHVGDLGASPGALAVHG
ncbi:hypothetical protein ACH4JZ_22400 [Streptomyces sp. NPDC017615]|uniref:hypothetical protein n=1 Tax=Streptomyces sp. NPDC017615 TaxID=3365003 RepID=UPI0037A379ED